MDTPTIISLIIALVGASTGIWATVTKAKDSRVDNLCQIIDAMAEEINRLRVRVADLELENQLLRRALIRCGLDPDEELGKVSSEVEDE